MYGKKCGYSHIYSRTFRVKLLREQYLEIPLFITIVANRNRPEHPKLKNTATIRVCRIIAVLKAKILNQVISPGKAVWRNIFQPCQAEP